MKVRLEELRISNLAIISELNVEFAEGLNILTGETGAGKSIILGGLDLILGERADSSAVRTGCEAATVEAVFSVADAPEVVKFLSDAGLSGSEGELIVRREVSAKGKSRCFINGRAAPLYQLQALGNMLVDLHGQHQHQSLLSWEAQLEVLDVFGGCERELAEYRWWLADFRKLAEEYRGLKMSEQERERLKDGLRFQINEIESAQLEAGEDESLEQERNRLQHAEKLIHGLSESYDILYEGERSSGAVVAMLDEIGLHLSGLGSLDAEIGKFFDKAKELRVSAEDLAFELRSIRDGIEEDPHRLEEVEGRLEELKKLKRKYGSSIGEILANLEKFKEQLYGIEYSAENLEKLEKELRTVEGRLIKSAEELSAKRKSAARQLEKRIKAELAELNMPKTGFSVEFALRGDGEAAVMTSESSYRFSDKGMDAIEFLLTPNVGEDLRPLARIASGGEISRIMLALKSIIAKRDRIPILVFDEIDVGISGSAAEKIGEKMSKLGKSHQVICITHLPQIAAKASAHYAVEKLQVKSRTEARVRRLSEAERLEEIARLIDGEKVSEIGRRHAEELLNR